MYELIAGGMEFIWVKLYALKHFPSVIWIVRASNIVTRTVKAIANDMKHNQHAELLPLVAYYSTGYSVQMIWLSIILYSATS